MTCVSASAPPPTNLASLPTSAKEPSCEPKLLYPCADHLVTPTHAVHDLCEQSPADPAASRQSITPSGMLAYLPLHQRAANIFSICHSSPDTTRSSEPAMALNILSLALRGWLEGDKGSRQVCRPVLRFGKPVLRTPYSESSLVTRWSVSNQLGSRGFPPSHQCEGLGGTWKHVRHCPLFFVLHIGTEYGIQIISTMPAPTPEADDAVEILDSSTP